MSRLHIDFETYSEADIRSTGAFRYIEDDSFEVILTAFAFDDEPVTVIDHTAGQTPPQSFMDALTEPSITKVAHNCQFERNVIKRVWGIYCDPMQWEDTMILSASCGLPLALGDISKALHLSSDAAKDRRGKLLINYFCKPQALKDGGKVRHMPADAPDKWAEFIEYNRQDVVAERYLDNLLAKWRPDDVEHRFWALDARINEKGVRLDTQLARNALQMDARYKAELTNKAIELTGLENPASVSQIKAWLKSIEGLEVESLNKKAMPDVLASLTTDKAKEFMAVRNELSKTSTRKYETMLNSVCKDGHIKGCFQFYGGHTGRFAGRLVQLQNLPQNHLPDLAAARSLVRDGDYETVDVLYGSVTSTLSELIRTALLPEPGCRLIVCDYSAIEARVTAYMAQEEWRLDVFRNGGDIYCASASQMFKVPVEKHGQNAHLRQKGKVAELALGYGGGAGAMKAFGADKMGMTEQEIAETVRMWRDSSPRIVEMWRAMERAARGAILNKRVTTSEIGGIKFRMEDGILWMRLPSGRKMAYYDPRVEEFNGKSAITYLHGKTRVSTFGGKLVENAVQAIARDCLRESMMALDAAGYDIRAHVHDEVIISCPEGYSSVEEVAEIMGRPLKWAPGLPLRGDGYETPYYLKD